MLDSIRGRAAFRWHVLSSLCLAAVLGFGSSSAIADPTTLYFSGTCTDCTGTGNLTLSVPDLVAGNQVGTPASVAYSSNLLGNLVSDPTSGQIFDGIFDSTALPGPAFMQIQFSAINSSGQDELYAFTSCGNTPITNIAGFPVCGTAAQFAAGDAGLAYGNWAISLGFFETTSNLPGGVGNKIQDYGTNGVWSLTAPTVWSLAAPTVAVTPEIDPSSALGALMLLLGSLAVMWGRRASVQIPRHP